MEDAYVGPVLIEGQASGEFFNQLFARNVSFARPWWVEDEGARRYFSPGALADRLGLRALSPQLSAYDDPAQGSYEGTPLIGAYAFDDEGIPARRVDLVAKGLLADLPMGRAPVKRRDRSNGHGRGAFHDYPSARIGNLFIASSQPVSRERLREQLLERAKEFGLPYGLIVRRIEETDSRDEAGMLAAPALVYRAYAADGRLELVRGAEFSGVSLRALRDVAAASQERSVYDFYQPGLRHAGGGETPAAIVSPDVLISEMELKKTEKKPERLPYLGHPYFK